MPVSAIHFHSLTKFPGLGGASTSIQTGTIRTSQNAMAADSIFLYRGEFVINGKYFMPKTSGAILCYEF